VSDVETALTLAEVLQLDAFRGVRLVSETGTDRPVRTANVMEVPDVAEWVRPGELLMTTLYALRSDTQAQADLIPKLAARQVGALAVKPRRFVDAIPPAMIEAANRHDFALLELPPDAYFSRLLEALLRELALREAERQRQDDFLRDWLLGRFGDTESLQAQARRAGCLLARHYAVLFVMRPAPEQADAATAEPAPAAGAAEEALSVERLLHRRFASRAGHLVAALEDGLVLLCPPEAAGDVAREARATLRPAVRGPLRIGVGRGGDRLTDVPRSAGEAREAAEVASALGLDAEIVRYEDLGLLRILHRLAGHEEVRAYTSEVLRPLLEYDRDHRAQFVETLEAFFRRNGNARAVSADLFMHYHTVLYRLERIQSVTGMRLDDPDDRLALHLALRIHRSGAARTGARGAAGA